MASSTSDAERESWPVAALAQPLAEDCYHGALAHRRHPGDLRLNHLDAQRACPYASLVQLSKAVMRMPLASNAKIRRRSSAFE